MPQRRSTARQIDKLHETFVVFGPQAGTMMKRRC
jgi:hypothetical protein